MVCAGMAALTASDIAPPDRERLSLFDAIQASAIEYGHVTGVYMLDDRVLHAMARVPRRPYVPVDYAGLAYLNVALPLAGPYSLPEPYLAALTLHCLDIDPGDKVYEAGLDSGYITAVMAELAGEVYMKPGADGIQPDEDRLGYDNVFIGGGDAYYGWKDKGPFDAILVNQSVEFAPWGLISQLAPGGRLVVPLGRAWQDQWLTLFTRDADGRIQSRRIIRVRQPALVDGQHI